MEGDEIFVTLISAVVAVLGVNHTSTTRMPALALRDVRWVGLNRLATLTVMICI